MENLSGSKNQASEINQLFQEVDCALSQERNLPLGIID